jgi:hypothetical protein
MKTMKSAPLNDTKNSKLSACLCLQCWHSLLIVEGPIMAHLRLPPPPRVEPLAND